VELTRRDFLKGAVAAALVGSLPRKAAASNPPSILWMSWDGADWRVIKAMLDAGQLPNLARLYCVRLEAAGCSLTKPGHNEVLTGLDDWKTKVFTNAKYKEVPKEWFLFWKVKQTFAGYWCGCILGKFQMSDGYGQPCRQLGLWARAGGLDHYYNCKDKGNSLTLEETNTRFQVALSEFQHPGLLYCLWAEPDLSGHKACMESALYQSALSQLDASLGIALNSVSPDYIFIYSDHGFDDPGINHHKNAPNGFLASNIPMSPYGIRRDLAYTLHKILQMPVEQCEPRLSGKDLRI